MEGWFDLDSRASTKVNNFLLDLIIFLYIMKIMKEIESNIKPYLTYKYCWRILGALLFFCVVLPAIAFMFVGF